MFYDNPEGQGVEGGGSFEREGTYVYLWLTHVNDWQKPAQHSILCTVSMKSAFFFLPQIPHVSDTTQYLYFSVWLISLTINPPRLIHIVTNSRISRFYG